jgi:hypothetical protein
MVENQKSLKFLRFIAPADRRRTGFYVALQRENSASDRKIIAGELFDLH